MRLFSTLRILPSQGQDGLGVAISALLGRAAGRVALDDEDLGERGVAHGAVGELAGKRRVLQRRLAPGQVACLSRRVSRARGVDRLGDDAARLARVLLEELAEQAVDGLLDQALDGWIAELRLRLTLELRIGELDRDHRGQSLAHVLAAEVLVLLLEQALAAGVGVEGARQRRAEAGEVRAALVGVDVVGEREHRLLIGRVPLHRDLDGAIRVLVLEEDRLLVHRVLVGVEVLDEVDDAAVVLKDVALAGAALVDDLDPQAAGEKGGLAHALGERRVVEVERLEDLGVGKEGDRGAAAVDLLAALEISLGLAAGEVLAPHVAVAVDLEVKPLGERVDDGDADAVQSARDLVAPAFAELAAGVKDGEHDLGRGALLLRMLVDRDAATVVDDGDAVVGMQRQRDRVAVARERLVDGVVDHLVDEMVQASGAGRADVHARALAHRIETTQDGDLVRGVAVRLAVFSRCRLLAVSARFCWHSVGPLQ